MVKSSVTWALVRPMPLSWLWKGIFFNAAILSMYWLLMNLFGMAALVEEFAEMGMILIFVTLLMGNATFYMMDYLLKMRFGRKR